MGYVLQIKEPRAGSDRSVLTMSVWSMSKIRDHMLALGAAHCASPPEPPFDLRGRCEHHTPGIPAYKLSMIDGWLVTDDEIREALAIMSENNAGSREDPDWKAWLDFLRDAAE